MDDIIYIKYNAIIDSIEKIQDTNELFNDIVHNIDYLLIEHHFELIDKLIDKYNLNLSITNQNNFNFLMSICMTDQKNITSSVQYLINKNISVEKTDNEGNTALFYCNFNIETLNVLFKNNVNYKHINDKNEDYIDYITNNFINSHNKTLSVNGTKMVNHFNTLVEYYKIQNKTNNKIQKTRRLL